MIDFTLDHPKDGYRRLAWTMVDRDVAHLSESAVHRILSERDLLRRWARPGHKGGQAPPPATAPDQRWHTDIMNLRLGDSRYFLVSFLDAYSRYRVGRRKEKLVAARENRRRVNRARAEAAEQERTNLPQQRPQPQEVSLSEKASWSHLN